MPDIPVVRRVSTRASSGVAGRIAATARAALAAAGLLTLLAAAAAAGAEPPAGTESSAVSETFERVELPPAPGQEAFPYTLDVPEGWRVQTESDTRGLWIGPPGTNPRDHHRLVYARFSPVSLADPAAVAASIEANAAEAPDWRAPVVEVRDFGGVAGVWVQMERGEGAEGRTTLVVKLPLGDTSVDFLATAGGDELGELRPLFERILLSLRPVAGGQAAP
jgi:hypothetical protein